MAEPTMRFLTELALALSSAKHKNVAEHVTAGLLWAMYPEWFDAFVEDKNARLVGRKKSV